MRTRHRLMSSIIFPLFALVCVLCLSGCAGAQARVRGKTVDTGDYLSKADLYGVMPYSEEDEVRLNWEHRPPIGAGIVSFGVIEHEKTRHCHVKMYYPITGKPAIDEEIKQFLTGWVDDFDERVREANRENAPEGQWGGDPPHWWLHGTYLLARPNSDVVSVVFPIFYSVGQALSPARFESMSFDLRTGRKLVLKDLFKFPNRAREIVNAWGMGELRKELSRMGVDEEPKGNFDLGDAPTLLLNAHGLQALFLGGGRFGGYWPVAVPLHALAPAAPNPEIWPQADRSISGKTGRK